MNAIPNYVVIHNTYMHEYNWRALLLSINNYVQNIAIVSMKTSKNTFCASLWINIRTINFMQTKIQFVYLHKILHTRKYNIIQMHTYLFSRQHLISLQNLFSEAIKCKTKV